ncbi:Rgp1-domain-containing protein [Dacryopinax primogenitus]|uniref:Rgp1-domain-containing protein n=1 Tax=Dacryopinax primogenitus (strain DJM 731) TaxID=1858805 RepID=M5FU12_DACPD|nr:Rgp1-domain-containing protein [Dacryopinax primogenitus]EJT98979.1 Rgp1-domain-containing protein [Dacryopinax primogenitus]
MSSSDAGIQVTVTPAQSAFFAGETFTVSVTFTNAHRAAPPRSQPRSASAAQTHRRGVQSVSSVPLARPPTSPGSPQTANALTAGFLALEDTPQRKRRGLVGHEGLQNPRVFAVATESSARRRRFTPKSLSVSITANELVERLVGRTGNSTPSSPECEAGGAASLRGSNAPFASHNLSSRARNAALPIHPAHPHARKQSVQDFQAQEVSTPFSLSLDPIAEHSAATPPTPFAPSPLPPTIPVLDNNVHQQRDAFTARQIRPNARLGQSKRSGLANATTDLGLGKPSSIDISGGHQPRSAFSSTFSPPGTEVLLWAYVQLIGRIELDEGVVPFHIVDKLKDGLSANSAVGRGSMDIGSSHSPSTSFLTSVLLQKTPRSPFMRHQRASPSLFSSLPSFGLSSLFSPSRSSPFSSPSVNRDEEDALPTLDLQPSVLAVDLVLSPGESRTYTYTLALPPSLPPTFRGKAVRFNYELLVGTCHTASMTAGISLPSPGIFEEHRKKKVMKIPVRVYNFVSVENPQLCYDLMWSSHADKSIRQGRVDEHVPNMKKTRDMRHSSECKTPASVVAKQLVDEMTRSDRLHFAPEEEELWSCREAVEILTRNSRKVSYDIGKDGEQVAVLTLVKSSYRVGETISGVVEFNNSSRARVLKFSAFLEAHEQLPTAFVNARHLDLRRVHAEYHSTLTTNTAQLPFSLDVPSDASPAFRFAAVDFSEGEGGLRWRVRVCFLVVIAAGLSRHLVPEGYEDDWGTAWRASSTLTPLASRGMPSPSSMTSTPLPGSWNSSAGSPSSGGEARNGGSVDWQEVKAETVECDIPLAIWPGNTLFRPVETIFAA